LVSFSFYLTSLPKPKVTEKERIRDRKPIAEAEK
jgi:hypothetical protein